jgi:pyruvate/2-oxoglutarate dehydrogenase complex dihydrolipoamide dehydrogenase (E3) component
MTSSKTDIIVIGAGPAGAIAALRAADLGARPALMARDEFGGMAANDGPVPVRTLAHATPLSRDARQFTSIRPRARLFDGRKFGFCKLIADRKTSKILGCHVIGERAVDIIQVAAIAIVGGMQVDELARVPLSFPTYAGILVNAAASAARQLGLELAWRTHQPEVSSR